MPKTPHLGEDELLRRAVRGDEDAFLEIYRAHQASLYRYAVRMSGSPWAAEAVLGLPPDFREAVVLCELEELSYEEAARLLDCPIGTIRSRLHRARALLLAKLEMWRSVPRRATAR